MMLFSLDKETIYRERLIDNQFNKFEYLKNNYALIQTIPDVVSVILRYLFMY